MTFGQHFVRGILIQVRVWIVMLCSFGVVYVLLNVGDWVHDWTGNRMLGIAAPLIIFSVLFAFAIALFSDYSEKKTKRRLRELEDKESKPKTFIPANGPKIPPKR